MIYIAKTPMDNPHPAILVDANLAIPLHEKPWGICTPIVGWRKCGLHKPSYAILSQPWIIFKLRRKLGSLEMEDRMRLIKAGEAIPSLRQRLKSLA